MTTATVTAPRKIWDELLSAKLLRQEDLDVCRTFLQGNPGAKVRDLIDFLRDEQILTEFQSEQIKNDNVHQLTCASYTLVDVLGKGSFGRVYKAKKHDTGKLYAMKILSERNPELVAKYAQRLQEFSRFRSRAIVPLVHIFCQHGKMSLVWPFVDEGQYGITLEQLVQREGKLSPKETALVALQTVQALQSVHGNDLFHGLLKPSNVLVTSKRAVRLLDFGIGFLLSVGRKESLLDTITHANQIASNLDCSSPETINDSSVRTPASDRYSLGCMLYYCLTGQYPFPDPNPVKKMLGHEMEEPTPIRELCPEVPRVLASIIHKLMSKEPEERYESTDDLLATLESLRGSDSGRSAKRRFVRPAPIPSSSPQFRPPAPEAMPSTSPTPAPNGTEDKPFTETPAFWVALTLLSAVVGAAAFWAN